MLRKCTRFSATLLLIAGLSACTKKGDTGPAGPAGPAGSSATSILGELNGHVSLYDQYGTRQYEGLQNIKLVLKTGNYTYADSAGYYIFPALTSAGYTVTASANGFGTTIFTAQVLGDTLYHDVKLSAVPDFQVATFAAYHNSGSQYDSLVLTFNSDSRPRNCLVLAGSTASVSNQPASYILAYTKAIPAFATKVIIPVPVTDLNGANIYFGQEVYYAAYSYVVGDVSVYEDQATGHNVYNAVGTPLIDSTTCP